MTEKALLVSEVIVKDKGAKDGLGHPRAITFMCLWYLFSLLTLFMNKIVMSSYGGDAAVLSECESQILFGFM